MNSLSTHSGDALDSDTQLLTGAEDIYLHLLRLQRAKAMLLLSISGSTQRYRSSLLELDRAGGRLAIDEVMPLDGNPLLQRAPGLNLSVHSDAGPSYWQLPAGALQTGIQAGLPCYWLPLPTEVRYIQRRRSFRATFLIGQAPPLAVLNDEGEVTAVGEMLDVSEHGCRFLIKAAGLPEWASMGQQLQVRIRPQDPPAFEVLGEVRHVAEHERQDAFMIGLHFTRIEPGMTRRLAQLVVQVQRERRRQQLAMDLD